MRALAGLVTAVFLSTPVWGQAVVVRSGDHDGFTRVTLALPETARWQLQEQNGRVSVTVNGISPRYDLSSVFDRITQERVASVSAADGILTIGLGCDCEVQSFSTGDLAVIDIIESGTPGHATLRRRWEFVTAADAYRFAALSDQSPRTLFETWVLSRGSNGSVEEFKLGATSLGDQAASERATERTQESSQLFPGQAFVPVIDQALIEDALARRKNVERSEESLREQVARAADRGLVDFQGSQDILPDEELEEQHTKSAARNPVQTRNVSLRTTSALSGDWQDTGAHPAIADAGVFCLPDSAIEVSSWASGRPFDAEIAQYRAALYGEFDRLNTDVAWMLARTYLHFGFAVEARQILSMSEFSSRDTAVLLSMASVIEEPLQPSPNAFLGQESCPSDTALWAVLAADQIETVRASDTTSVLRAFSRLPSHLQAHLGPRLVALYSEAGDIVSADAVARALGRNPDHIGGEPALGGSTLTAAMGDAVTTTAIQNQVLEANTGEAPEALIDQIDHAWSQKWPVDPALVEVLASYEFEYRRSDFAEPLRHARLRALSLLGEYDAAQQVLAQIEDPALSNQAFGEVTEMIATNASDFDLVRHAFSLSEFQKELLASGTRDRISERLDGLGFKSEAVLFSDAVQRVQVFTEARRPASVLPPVVKLNSPGVEFAAVPEARGMGVEYDETTVTQTAMPTDDAEFRTAEVEADALPADDPGPATLIRARSLLKASQTARESTSTLLESGTLNSGNGQRAAN